MELSAVDLKVSLRATRKRAISNSSSQVTCSGIFKRKKIREVPKPAKTLMKETCAKMQTVSVGLQRVQPLAKENGGYSLRNRKQQLCFQEEEMADVSEAPSQRQNPLPHLTWVRSEDLWSEMRVKDMVVAAPESKLRLHHPEILPSMRTILLDWLMEVCEEYKLHRETFYLAVDLSDRFLDARRGAQKEQLQLLGITCLFIAAKIEEIYPPKVTEFAYVTDGACSVSDVLDMELVICKALNWRLNHFIVTVNTWASIYMQLSSHHLRPLGVKAKEFEYPAFSCLEFIQVMQLLDLCVVDIASRQFSSSVLAASAIYLISEKSRPNLTLLTGLEVSDIQLCAQWMHPSAAVLMHKGPVHQKKFRGVPPHDSHNIQTHSVSISMLDDAMELRRAQEAAASTCPLTLLQDCSVLMTPPRQERRCLVPINSSATY